MTAAPIAGDARDWIGREESRAETIAPFPARAMAALLDRDPESYTEGSPLPECWHWLHFHAPERRSRLGPDGHPLRGGFLPPVALPRRMWAGGRLRFLRPLLIGERGERRSRILAVEEKRGRSGSLVRVTVLHTLSDERGPAVEEEQDLIYREAPGPGASPAPRPPAPEGAEWRESVPTDAVLLFRFSALTFNGHRIHYDHPYATGVEGYPGLVVHGPLLALLLLDAAKRHTGLAPAAFEYRATSPVFAGETVELQGRTGGDETEAWATGPSGALAMRATVGWAR